MSSDAIRRRLAAYAQGRRYLQGGTLIARLMADEGLDRLAMREALRHLRETGEVSASQWLYDEPFGSVIVNIQAIVTQAEQQWRAALVQAEMSFAEQEALLDCWQVLEDWEADDLTNLARALLKFKQSAPHGLLFEVSSRYLLGSSKLLRSLPFRSLQRFGIDPSKLDPLPPALIVAGAAHPLLVLLIENPHAFEAALPSVERNEVALVATLGFGLSLQGEDHGYSLVEAVEQSRGVRSPRRLVRAGVPPELPALLTAYPLAFWGDLDPAAWSIFRQLKRWLPTLCLSGLYRPMLAHLAAGRGHPLTHVVGKSGQRHPPSMDDAPSWWPTVRGVDQEIVRSEEIDCWISTILDKV